MVHIVVSAFSWDIEFQLLLLVFIAIIITEDDLIWDFIPPASNMDACLVFGTFVPLFLNMAGPFII